MASAEAIHVAGPAILWLGRGDGGSADMRRLGLTDENGFTIEPQVITKEVKSDFAGSGMPADYVHLGRICRVFASLISWDADQLEIWRGGFRGRRGNALSTNDIGRMMLAGNRYFKMLIQTSAATEGVLESPYRFPVFMPDGPTPVNVGNRPGRVRITGVAHPYNGFCYVRA
jgi:hypothetical protein